MQTEEMPVKIVLENSSEFNTKFITLKKKHRTQNKINPSRNQDG